MKKTGTVSDRRKEVELLFFMHDLPIPSIAELLGVRETIIRDDIQHVSNMLRERAGRCSESAEEAFEEVAGLLFVARQAIGDAQLAHDDDKANFYNAAARSFFLAGRLKQGRRE